MQLYPVAGIPIFVGAALVVYFCTFRRMPKIIMYVFFF